MSKHDWKPDFMERGSSATSLWFGNGRSDGVYYSFRIGSRDIYVSRGEIVGSVIAGLLAGLFFAGVQTGAIHLPRPSQPALVHYDAPKPRLLGSTERTRPVDPTPRQNFVDYPSYSAQHSTPARADASVSSDSFEAMDDSASGGGGEAGTD